jgi:TRAP-type transport system periplasmic protein
MRKYLLVLFVLGLAMLVVACGQAAPTGQAPQAPAAGGEGTVEPLTIRFAHAGSDTHPYAVGIREWQPLLEQASGGAITLQVFGDAQLGGEREAAEGVRLGTIDMTSVAADGALPSWVPELQALGLPYVIRDRPHAYAILDGPIGQEWEQKLLDQGFVVLTWWELGFRNMTTRNTPINGPEDVRGLKIRVQESPVWLAFINSLGAIPTPIAFNDLYTALQQGVVDGQENPIVTIMAMKFFEVQRHVALTEHVYTSLPVMASKQWWDGLTEAQQTAIRTSLEESQSRQRQAVERINEEGVETLRAEGVNITTPDKSAFEELTKDVPKAVEDRVPADLVQRMRDTR